MSLKSEIVGWSALVSQAWAPETRSFGARVSGGGRLGRLLVGGAGSWLSSAMALRFRGHPDTAAERGRPSPLPPSHPAGRDGRGGDPFLRFTQGGGPSRQCGTGLALGWYEPRREASPWALPWALLRNRVAVGAGFGTVTQGRRCEGVKKMKKPAKTQTTPLGNQRLTTANFGDFQFFHTFCAPTLGFVAQPRCVGIGVALARRLPKEGQDRRRERPPWRPCR